MMTNSFLLLVLIAAALIYVPILLTRRKTDVPKSEQPKSKASAKPAPHPQYLLRLKEVRRQAELRGDTATIQAVDNMTYTGPLPTRKPDMTFTAIGATILEYNVAGINFRKGLARYEGPFMGYMLPEPSNAYDPNAIAIYHEDGKHLGYIPSDETDDIRALSLPFPITIWGEIEKDYDFDERRTFYRGTIYIELPKVSPPKS